MTTRKAEALWQGSLREGSGEIALESGVATAPASSALGPGPRDPRGS
jgi:hypothetical protein